MSPNPSVTGITIAFASSGFVSMLGLFSLANGEGAVGGFFIIGFALIRMMLSKAGLSSIVADVLSALCFVGAYFGDPARSHWMIAALAIFAAAVVCLDLATLRREKIRRTQRC